MRINLPLYSYQLRSRPASPARLVNCFPEILPAGAKTPVMITRSPGIKAWATVGTGPIRGMYAQPIEFASGRLDRLWVVSDDELYEVDSSGSTTLIGTVPGTGRVTMSSNDDELIIVAEPRGFTYDGATFAEVVDDDFVSRGSAQVDFLDGFFVHREPNSNRYFLSDIGDGTLYDSLQFVKCNDHPDELAGIIAYQGQLMCFGDLTLEMYENTGSAGVPFTRIINGTIEVGCADADTISRCYDQIFWVADDFTVRRLDGIMPSRVSQHAIEQKLADETILEAFSYDQEGHSFYCLSTSAGTYTYDVMTQEWSERETYGDVNWTVRYHSQFSGKELVGDWQSNKIGELDPDTYTDWGSTQRMEWTYQPVYADGQRAFHDRLEIVLETGVGATTGQGSDPKIMLEKSDDGGVSWQSLPDRTFGKRGETLSRAIWHNLGSARERVYRAAISDPVPVTVTDTLLEVKGGRL